VGRGAVVLVHCGALPPGPWQRHRAQSERSHDLNAWNVAGGYAYQDGQITRSISASALAGASLAQLPKHSISLWNKYDFTPRFAAALGIIYRDDVFTSTDNLVMLPSWTRFDAAMYYNLTSMWRAQVNIENLFDEDYYLNAHSNTNITPGSPRAVRFALATRF
jgi:catecholate siderophore receptor